MVYIYYRERERKKKKLINIANMIILGFSRNGGMGPPFFIARKLENSLGYPWIFQKNPHRRSRPLFNAVRSQIQLPPFPTQDLLQQIVVPQQSFL